MNERGFHPEQGRMEEEISSPAEVKVFLTQKITTGETITVGRSDGSKSEGIIYNIDRETGDITTSFEEDGKVKYKKVDLVTFLKWQGISIETPKVKAELPEPPDAKNKILSAGGLLALGALSTYTAAKLEGFFYPNLLETYNDTNTFLEDMAVFVAHHFEKNPTTTMLVGSCIAAIHIALEKRKAAQRKSP